MGLPSEIITGLMGSSGYSGYQIDQSMVLDGSSDYVTWTPGGSGSDNTRFTFSCFFKKCALGKGTLLNAGTSSSSKTTIGFTSGDNLEFAQADGSSVAIIQTDALFRDFSSWYHVVIIYNSNEASSSDRIKIIVNGVELSFTEVNSIDSARAVDFATTDGHSIGRRHADNDEYFNGYIAEILYLDGQVGAATDFGEFYNGTTAWRPIQPSGLTYGTNGFYLPFTQDTPNLGTDYSGNGNDWTENGSPVQSSDSPTKNIAVLNSLIPNSYLTFSNGNRTVTHSGGTSVCPLSIYATSGKFYCEIDVVGTGTWFGYNGVVPADDAALPDHVISASDQQDGYIWTDYGPSLRHNTGDISVTPTFANGDTLMIALDMDNGWVFFGKNGTWYKTDGTTHTDLTDSANAWATDLLAISDAGWTFAAGASHVSGTSSETVKVASDDWTYPGAAADFKSLSAVNLPDPTITDGSNNFKTTTWTGYTPTLYEQTRISSSTTINNSMLLDGSTDYLNWTAGTATDSNRWTYSAWIKRSELGRDQSIFGAGSSASDAGYLDLWFRSDDKLQMGGTATNWRRTSQVFRDVGAYGHLVVAVDTDQATAGDRIKIYWNGVQITSFDLENNPGSGNNIGVNVAGSHRIGRQHNTISGANYYFNGYMSEINFVDGQQLEPTSFGEFNSDKIWSPKAVSGLTYGTNGFFLPFTQDAPNLGVDYSGNGNDWTENGSPTQSSDSPTVNYATFNVVDIRQSGAIFSEGNLRFSTSTAAVQKAASTIAFDASGHYYAEFLVNATSGTNRESIGIINTANFGDNNNAGGYGANEYCIRLDDGNKYNNNSEVAYGDSYAATDVVGVRVDNGSLYFYKNGTIQNSGVPAYTGISGSCRFFVTIDDGGTNPDITARFNSTDWTIGTPPTGANDLSSSNLPAISDSDLYFNGGSADLVWIKSRSAATSHKLIDIVRGVGLNMSSDSTAAETGEATVNRIDKYGIHLGDDADVNNAAATYVAWMWKAGGSGVVNTDGTISSTVSVNDDAGCSIVSYTGTGSAATVGHGQSAAPEMIIFKKRDGTLRNWTTWHHLLANGANGYLGLNAATAEGSDSTVMNGTEPTSSVFSVGTFDGTNGSGVNHIAYCFRSIPGYSKVFSYEGNGSADGPFVYLGFKPKFLLIKSADGAYSWWMYDSEREQFNIVQKHVYANASNAEVDSSTYAVDFLSNGLKIRTSTVYINNSHTYVGIAFAENPFGGSNLPLGLAQ